MDKFIGYLGRYYRNMPPLPGDGREWLIQNIWWLALVGGVANTLSLLTVLPHILNSLHADITVGYTGGLLGLGGLRPLISLAIYIATITLLLLAVRPLRRGSGRGWKLLFVSIFVNCVLNIVNYLLVPSIFHVVVSIAIASVAGYMLFEIKSGFESHVHHKGAKKLQAKVKKPTKR